MFSAHNLDQDRERDSDRDLPFTITGANGNYNTSGPPYFTHQQQGDARQRTRGHQTSNASWVDQDSDNVTHSTDDTIVLVDNDGLDVGTQATFGAQCDQENESHRLFVEHCHVPREKADKVARNQLITVSVLCTIFMIAEVIGGTVSGSLALITDATHLASDITGFMVSLVAIWMATKPPTARMSFGYYRAEVLGAMISILIIWVITGVLVYEAIKRLINRDFEINPNVMLITAALGVLFNIIMGLVLHFGTCCGAAMAHGHSHGLSGHSHSHDDSDGHHHEHGHGHGHSHENVDGNTDAIETGGEHGHEIQANGHRSNCSNSDDHTAHTETRDSPKRSRKKNINVRAAFIHVIGDLIQSTGVFIAAIIIRINCDYKLADPICTLLFSVLVMCTTAAVVRDAVLVLMEGVPRDVNFKAIKEDLEKITGVKAAHSLHVWALTVDKNAVAVHLAVAGDDTDWDNVLTESTKLLRERYQAFQSTVQVERYQELIMANCDQCKPPRGC